MPLSILLSLPKSPIKIKWGTCIWKYSGKFQINIICGLFLPSIKRKVQGCLLPFESFRFQDAIRTIDLKSCASRNVFFCFKVVMVWNGLKCNLQTKNDILVGVACVPQLNGILSKTEIITHGYHHFAEIWFFQIKFFLYRTLELSTTWLMQSMFAELQIKLNQKSIGI